MPDEAPAGAQRSRGGGVAFAFALCAAFACWNVAAAPFGLMVGLSAAVLAIRALRRVGAPRRLAALALVLSVVAAVTSAVVVARTAGTVGADLPGEQVVKGRTREEVDQILRDAAERTRVRRQRATADLESAAGARDGGSPQREGRRDGGSAAAPGSGR